MRTVMRSLLLPALLLVCMPTPAGERVLSLDPEATEVTFLLPATGHDIHGHLYLQSGEIRFDPVTGAASGEVIIDAVRSVSGNKNRDKKMHKKVLESAIFPHFVFKPERIDGHVALDGKSEFDIVGTLSIHGDDHPFTLHTLTEISGEQVTAETTFPVPYIEWGMRNPSILFLRVAKVVEVTVAARGELPEAGDETGSAR